MAVTTGRKEEPWFLLELRRPQTARKPSLSTNILRQAARGKRSIVCQTEELSTAKAILRTVFSLSKKGESKSASSRLREKRRHSLYRARAVSSGKSASQRLIRCVWQLPQLSCHLRCSGLTEKR